jgi:hypothetical protein
MEARGLKGELIARHDWIFGLAGQGDTPRFGGVSNFQEVS